MRRRRARVRNPGFVPVATAARMSCRLRCADGVTRLCGLLLHKRPQRVVDAVLPAGPRLLEMIQDVAIEAQRDHLLGARNGRLGRGQFGGFRGRLPECGLRDIARGGRAAVFGRSTSDPSLSLRHGIERTERRHRHGPLRREPEHAARCARAPRPPSRRGLRRSGARRRHRPR